MSCLLVFYSLSHHYFIVSDSINAFDTMKIISFFKDIVLQFFARKKTRPTFWRALVINMLKVKKLTLLHLY